MRYSLGHILTYYDSSQPQCAQYVHLTASMLTYAHIYLFVMLLRFILEEAARVATDSIYKNKAALYKLVNAFVGKKKPNCGEDICPSCLPE